MAARGGGAQRSNVIPREKVFQFKLVLVGEGKGEREGEKMEGRREKKRRKKGRRRKEGRKEGRRERERGRVHRATSLKQNRLQSVSFSG